MKKNINNDDAVVGNLVRVKLVIGGNANGSVVARELSRETAANHGADERSLKTSVTWMPADKRKLIGGAVAALRAAFNSRTLPWEDGGWRVVPADRYTHLMDQVAERKATVESAVNDIRRDWDDIMADAKKRLNGALKLVELPTRDEYADGFSVDLTSTCVVAPDDVRITGLDDATLDRIRRQVKDKIGAKITASVELLGNQVVEMLNDLMQRMEKPDQKGVRYDGWVKWARQTIENIRPLNITNNAGINALLDRVEAIAKAIDPHSMRNSGPERTRIKNMMPAKQELEAFCK